MQNLVFIDIPKRFSFKSTVYSHGWCELAPFELDIQNWRLSYVFRDKNGHAIPAVISEVNGKLKIEAEGSEIDAIQIINETRHLLRLDDDLNGFYDSIIGHERLNWVGKLRAGRMLRSATVFEDIVKTICTTNCSWALTKNMTTNLVEKLGTAPSSNTQNHAKRAFPTAEAMAAVTADFYRTEIRAGYRSPYFVELAETVASGRLDPQKWLKSGLSTTELKREIKKIKGVGDYAAENLLKLLGRYDGLALDSWLRSQFYKNHNKEKPCTDKKIERHYKKFGEWRGLVMWCDMTEKWISDADTPF